MSLEGVIHSIIDIFANEINVSSFPRYVLFSCLL